MTSEEEHRIRSVEDYRQYAEFLRRHREELWSMCWHYARQDEQLCKDIVQEVSIFMWLMYDSFPTDKPNWKQKLWMYDSTRRVVRNITRKASHDIVTLNTLFNEQDYNEDNGYSELMDEILSKFNDEDKTILRMRIDGYQADTIGEVMGLKTNAVYQRVGRIINKIHTMIEKGEICI